MNALILCLAIISGLPTGKALVYPSDLATMDNVLLVDVRPDKQFEKGHLKGAVNLDSKALLAGRGAFLPLAGLRAVVGEAGIDPDKQIVIYGSAATVDTLEAATQLFWALEYLGFPQVAILDGGYEGSLSSKREIEKGDVKPEPINLEALTPRPERLAKMGEVLKRNSTTLGCPVDFRPNELYAGMAQDPTSSRAGHIPRAKNVPQQEVLDSGPLTSFKPIYQLQNILVDRGVDTNTPTIAYGSSASDATMGYFVLRASGREEVSLYPGSIGEWGNNQKVKMELPKAATSASSN